MACFDAFWAVFFICVLARKMLNFPPAVIRLTLKMLLGSIEYCVRVLGIVSFSLHCIASNVVLKILKHDKILETIFISIPHSKFWEDSFPLFPHDLRMGTVKSGHSLR